MTTQSNKQFFIIKPGQKCDGCVQEKGAIKVIGDFGLHLVRPGDVYKGTDYWDQECENLKDWLIETSGMPKSLINYKIKKLKQGVFLL